MKTSPKPKPSHSQSSLGAALVWLQAGIALFFVYSAISVVVALFSSTTTDFIGRVDLILYLGFILWLPLLFALLGRRSGKKRPLKNMLVSLDLSTPTWKDIGWGLIIALAALQLLAILSVALDWLGLVDSGQKQAAIELVPEGGWDLFWFFVTVCLLVPIVEEIVFRRWIYRPLAGRIGFWAALAISSVVFGLAHFEASTPGAVVLAAILGVVFVLVYRWSGNLWTPIVAHMTVNALAIVAQVLGY